MYEVTRDFCLRCDGAVAMLQADGLYMAESSDEHMHVTRLLRSERLWHPKAFRYILPLLSYIPTLCFHQHSFFSIKRKTVAFTSRRYPAREGFA